MFARLKTLASLSILVGTVLLLAKVEETYNLYNAPYILLIAGVIALLFSLLATNKEENLLCRIGLHKYVRLNRDYEVPALFIYKCKRCGKRKKAASTI